MSTALHAAALPVPPAQPVQKWAGGASAALTDKGKCRPPAVQRVEQRQHSTPDAVHTVYNSNFD